MAQNSQRLLDQVRAAAIDGRALNVRYRQNQLQTLHHHCRTNHAEIRDAIAREQQLSPEEADLEFLYALNSISQLYERLDFDKALDEEYSVARGADNSAHRSPYGVVVIRPQAHSRFYSSVVPFATAITAGCCAVLELLPTTSQTDHILRKIISQLDQDAYIVFQSAITNSSFLEDALLIDQRADATHRGPAVVAVVDRTADVESAAKELSRSATLFNGKSPYKPRVILVNEFVKDRFVKSFTASCSATATAANLSSRPSRKIHQTEEKSLEKNETMVFESPSLTLIDSTGPLDSSSSTDDRRILLQPTTGLVDSVSRTRKSQRFLASYIFADETAAKFLGQSIDSESTYINHIPLQLQVGPAAHLDKHTPDPTLRYSLQSFSRPSPQYIRQDPTALTADDLDTASGGRTSKRAVRKHAASLQEQLQKALAPLKPIDQHSGSSKGFFDQGIMTGLVAFVLPTISLVGYVSFWAARHAWQRFSVSN